jgi:hypothetical protein
MLLSLTITPMCGSGENNRFSVVVLVDKKSLPDQRQNSDLMRLNRKLKTTGVGIFHQRRPAGVGVTFF